MYNMGISKALVVQKKLIPCKKPRKSGGSPNGVNAPPIFATRKIKNTMVCTLNFLHLLARKIGLISNMDAPVVPIHDAKIIPIDIMATFILGEPDNSPLILIPPEIVYNENKIRINGIYSKSIT